MQMKNGKRPQSDRRPAVKMLKAWGLIQHIASCLCATAYMCCRALITRELSATWCWQEAESRCTPSVAYAAYYRDRYSAVTHSLWGLAAALSRPLLPCPVSPWQQCQVGGLMAFCWDPAKV